MEIKELNKLENTEQNKKLVNNYSDFNTLLNELRTKDIPLNVVNVINQEIDGINSFSGSKKALLKYIRKSKSNIFKLIEKELKLVPKNLYRNRWMALGMAVFGIPFGIAFGTSLKNMAFIGIGIPIGMAVGIAIGTDMDKKAFKEGRQLDIEFKQ